MGFLDKLFGGGKKSSDFVPSSDLMPEEKFWQLIGQSLKAADGDSSDQEHELELLLWKLPLQDLISFQNRYRQLRGAAYTWPLWGAAYIINGGCSDDGFCYFRDWLISRGREVYTNALTKPEWLANLDLEEDESEAEGMAYVAESVFTSRTGQDLPAEYVENYTISGEEWQEEGDDLQRMFPILWQKYN
jgi:hypothetical protein